MPTWTGLFNAAGNPILKITLTGALGTAQEFDALVDTGFSGFLLMPTVKALPLGLILYGTTSVELADGSNAVKWTALGTASVGAESVAGIVILENNTSVPLVGMDFLRRFKKTLIVHEKNTLVALVDDSDVEQFIAGVLKIAAEAKAKKDAETAAGSPPEATTTSES